MGASMSNDKKLTEKAKNEIREHLKNLLEDVRKGNSKRTIYLNDKKNVFQLNDSDTIFIQPFEDNGSFGTLSEHFRTSHIKHHNIKTYLIL